MPPQAPPKPKLTASNVPAPGIALDSMLNQLGEEARAQGVNTTPKGHCRTCDKMIMGQVVTAMGNTYHPEHFICSHCEKELGTETFFERDDNPYCEGCCHYLFSPKCAYCEGPITGKPTSMKGMRRLMTRYIQRYREQFPYLRRKMYVSTGQNLASGAFLLRSLRPSVWRGRIS